MLFCFVFIGTWVIQFHSSCALYHSENSIKRKHANVLAMTMLTWLGRLYRPCSHLYTAWCVSKLISTEYTLSHVIQTRLMGVVVVLQILLANPNIWQDESVAGWRLYAHMETQFHVAIKRRAVKDDVFILLHICFAGCITIRPYICMFCISAVCCWQDCFCFQSNLCIYFTSLRHLKCGGDGFILTRSNSFSSSRAAAALHYFIGSALYLGTRRQGPHTHVHTHC